MKNLLFLINYCILIAVLAAARNEPIVETTFGPVTGSIFTVPEQEGEGLYFLGVQYAAPPVSLLRFEAPQDPEPWTEILDATKFGPRCPQDISGSLFFEYLYNVNMSYVVDMEMSEDCLLLNVFTPALVGLRPVMVFIHGGSLNTGSAGGYDNRYLATGKDIVSVHIQYRLGPLGWIATGEGIIAGNMGFKDQIKALNWVKDNIANFGGNPEDITIYGESAGGWSVSLHLVSPYSAGLFSKAILQSGSMVGMNTFSPPRDLPEITRILADLLGCPITNDTVMVSCLRSLDSDMFWKPITPGESYPFLTTPIVDGEYFPDLPQKSIEDGTFNKDVDVMLGNLEIEGYMFMLSSYPAFLLPGFDREEFLTEAAMPRVQFYYPDVPDKWEVIAEAITEEYAADLEGDELKLAASEMYGDIALCVYPYLTTELLSVHSDAEVYFYEFHQRPSVSIRPEFVPTDHVDDLAFLGCTKSGTFMNSEVNFTEEDKVMDDIMLDYWVNFARNGDPNGDGLLNWPSYRDNRSYIRLQVSPDIATDYKPERMKFWLETIPNLIQDAE